MFKDKGVVRLHNDVFDIPPVCLARIGDFIGRVIIPQRTISIHFKNILVGNAIVNNDLTKDLVGVCVLGKVLANRIGFVGTTGDQ